MNPKSGIILNSILQKNDILYFEQNIKLVEKRELKHQKIRISNMTIY